MDETRFMVNVREARENGYDLVCAECGVGMNDEDFDDAEAHEARCPHRGRDRAAEMEAFIAKRLGTERRPT